MPSGTLGIFTSVAPGVFQNILLKPRSGISARRTKVISVRSTLLQLLTDKVMGSIGTCTRRRAANQGDALAQFMLGVMYENGEGATTKQNREGSAKIRDGVAATMTPSQIAEAQKLAREWKPKPER
jgi:hypothetical protein